jgi:hypothetical protein
MNLFFNSPTRTFMGEHHHIGMNLGQDSLAAVAAVAAT